MPISLRRSNIDDIIQMQNANLHNLPENYNMWYWFYHYMRSPQTAHVSVDSSGKVLGYVIGMLSDDETENNEPPHGHITSVAVYRRYRKLGFASKLLTYTHRTLRECYKAEYVGLNVRETNRAGHVLYMNRFGYKIVRVDEGYYADGENGWLLRYTYPPDSKEQEKQ